MYLKIIHKPESHTELISQTIFNQSYYTGVTYSWFACQITWGVYYWDIV